MGYVVKANLDEFISLLDKAKKQASDLNDTLAKIDDYDFGTENKKRLETLTKWYRSATSLKEKELLLNLMNFYHSN